MHEPNLPLLILLRKENFRAQLLTNRFTVFAAYPGDVGQHRDDKACVYSRCIRQRLANISRDQQWAERHNSLYGETLKLKGSYGEQLSSAVFCLVPPGDLVHVLHSLVRRLCCCYSSMHVNLVASCAIHFHMLSPVVCSGDGFSTRFEDAILHGCIPVIVNDNVMGAKFISLLQMELHVLLLLVIKQMGAQCKNSF